MTIDIDTSTKFGVRVDERLRTEIVIWLTTTDPGGTPQPRPVWFLWVDGEFLIYSKEDTFKLEHIAREPRVALNFNSNERGGDIVVFTGRAWVSLDDPPADQVPAYVAKYADHIDRIGYTPETFAANYSVPIRVEPLDLRGH